ncbi:rRNA-processing protein LAS1 [Ascoidea rubescens DSM 1968]|uniref:Las1-domain-containing protein n=1 Tax=Ascoidea rubescens DSM 1968 TaxID=1344418 RepID=A0A1D2VGS0_9ASCO|nr:Las1-domain-containing protein [Ascoidea rubescens DSM 1968]ODV60835.1 Las1-domain-containing protein [Ascoidea rubescens DSM 1968]
MNPPRLVAWKSEEDLIKLRHWFYDFNEHLDNRKLAINYVNILRSRNRLPHSIESTSQLTASIITDSISLNGSDAYNYHANAITSVKLSYSMALIRFVNGILDPLQQSVYAIPLSTLARHQKLPQFFVEIRHMSTHETLPDIQLLRDITQKALAWLYDNYWCFCGVKNTENKSNNDADNNKNNNNNLVKEDPVVKINDNYIKQINSLKQNLKLYKSFKKENLLKVVKIGDNSTSAKNYWNNLNNILIFTNSKELLIKNQFVLMNLLIFKNILIPNKSLYKKKKIIPFSQIKLLNLNFLEFLFNNKKLNGNFNFFNNFFKFILIKIETFKLSIHLNNQLTLFKKFFKKIDFESNKVTAVDELFGNNAPIEILDFKFNSVAEVNYSLKYLKFFLSNIQSDSNFKKNYYSNYININNSNGNDLIAKSKFWIDLDEILSFLQEYETSYNQDLLNHIKSEIVSSQKSSNKAAKTNKNLIEKIDAIINMQSLKSIPNKRLSSEMDYADANEDGKIKLEQNQEAKKANNDTEDNFEKDLQNLRKRIKLIASDSLTEETNQENENKENSKSTAEFFLELHENWQITPFGVTI